jgi:sensitive to high expression protein 9
MSLIRSEHINDQAIRLAKDSVINAEAALEEARTQLEKRERAQYHEEQIWSDTIRRNSTWVTFGLMGVNIFLLLLSLAILEPWRRRRMVREIKSALEAQQAVNKPASASSVTAVASSTTEQDIALIGEDVDQITDIDETKLNPATSAALETVVEDLPAAEAIDDLPVNARPEAPESVADPVSDITVPIAAIAAPNNEESTSYLESGFRQEASGRDGSRGKPNGWQSKITSIAQDVISERIISMRRIDYTTAILQGAAAGAVITAAIIAMLRST